MDVILQHTVRDFDAWKPVFDEHEPVRAKYGCTGCTVYRAADSPNDVTVVLSWESRERAEEFYRDPSLREAMERGGVVSEPKATWVEKVDSSSYKVSRAA